MGNEFQTGQDVGGALRGLFTLPKRMREQREQEQLSQALFAKLLQQQGMGADAGQAPQLPPGAVPPGSVVSEGAGIGAQLLKPGAISAAGTPTLAGPTLGYEPPPAPPPPAPDLSVSGRRMDPGALLQMLHSNKLQADVAERQSAQQQALSQREEAQRNAALAPGRALLDAYQRDPDSVLGGIQDQNVRTRAKLFLDAAAANTDPLEQASLANTAAATSAKVFQPRAEAAGVQELKYLKSQQEQMRHARERPLPSAVQPRAGAGPAPKAGAAPLPAITGYRNRLKGL